MARIVKLAKLLPEDIAIELPGGTTYLFPGDPPLRLIFKIASLFERSQADEEGSEEGVALEVLQALDDQILHLLQMRDPAIDESPFGVIGAQHVVAELLKAYNFGVEAEADPTPRKPARAKSRRSTGSQGS